MASYNWNHGWGRLIANKMAQQAGTGKVIIACNSDNALYMDLLAMFPETDKSAVRTTLQLAIDEATLEADGSAIFVAPNYTETIIAAGGLDTGTDTAGLKIIGLGEGDERPLISYSTSAAADFNIGSNGVTVENMRFDFTGVDALTGPIDVNDSGVTFRNCEFTTADSSGQCVTGIVTDANASDLTIEDCYFYGSENAGTTSAIRIVGGNRAKIKNNHIEGAFKTTAGGIEVTTTAAGFLEIKGNVIKNKTASSTRAINLVEGTRATIVDNDMHVLSGTSPVSVAESLTTLTVGGYVTVSRNYFTTTTGIVAGTLL